MFDVEFPPKKVRSSAKRRPPPPHLLNFPLACVAFRPVASPTVLCASLPAPLPCPLAIYCLYLSPLATLPSRPSSLPAAPISPMT